MGKIRHIAYRAADVEEMANFFVNALGRINHPTSHNHVRVLPQDLGEKVFYGG